MDWSIVSPDGMPQKNMQDPFWDYAVAELRKMYSDEKIVHLSVHDVMTSLDVESERTASSILDYLLKKYYGLG